MTAETERHRTVQQRPGVGREGRIWFGLAGAPGSWVIQEAAGWFVGGRVCGSLTVTSTRISLSIVSLAALAVALSAVAVGWRNWRNAAPGTSRSLTDTDASDRAEFLSLAGLLVSVVFSIAIVWASLSAAMLPRCGWMR